ncbi:hypothetical protein F4780DRAFT_574229 [Xylariomycetidae sp. FL0641]|nr:hypothetical protein F4780DRAFT_574229 [Xylariomycetidae sp. FL0641]
MGCTPRERAGSSGQQSRRLLQFIQREHGLLHMVRITHPLLLRQSYMSSFTQGVLVCFLVVELPEMLGNLCLAAAVYLCTQLSRRQFFSSPESQADCQRTDVEVVTLMWQLLQPDIVLDLVGLRRRPPLERDVRNHKTPASDPPESGQKAFVEYIVESKHSEPRAVSDRGDGAY